MIFKGHSIRDSTGENPNFKGHQALLSTELDQNKGQPELRTVGVDMQIDYVNLDLLGNANCLTLKSNDRMT